MKPYSATRQTRGTKYALRTDKSPTTKRALRTDKKRARRTGSTRSITCPSCGGGCVGDCQRAW